MRDFSTPSWSRIDGFEPRYLRIAALATGSVTEDLDEVQAWRKISQLIEGNSELQTVHSLMLKMSSILEEVFDS